MSKRSPAATVSTATCLHPRLLERSTATVTQPLTVDYDPKTGALSIDYTDQIGMNEKLVTNAWVCAVCGKVWATASTLDSQELMWAKVVAEISKRRAAAGLKPRKTPAQAVAVDLARLPLKKTKR